MNAAVHNVPDGQVEPGGLQADQIDAVFSGLESFSKLALAVSGGADSLCLLVLFSEWQKRKAWPGTAEVLTVDHGLRAESAAEAKFVAECADKLGLACTVFRWSGEKPSSNLQEEARLARYRMMADHMIVSGAEALLLGHHLNDQAETFLDRLTRGSGVSGLGAMAADAPDGPEGLRLLRPFLGIRKAQLEASLRARGQDWCTDPSNREDKYKRSRLRRIMSLLEDEGLSMERIGRTTDHMRQAKAALEWAVRDIVASRIVEHRAGPLKLDREAYREIPEDLRLRLLTYMIARATGLRPRTRLQKLQALDNALKNHSEGRQTLAGAVFDADAGTVRCWKEPGRTPPQVLSALCGEGIWDNRFRYFVPPGFAHEVSVGDLLLGPLLSAPVTSGDVLWPEGWPKEAFSCAPVFWTSEGTVLQHSATVSFDIGDTGRSADLELERVPIRGKLAGNHMDEGDANGEI